MRVRCALASARSWLDQNLFPESPPTPPITARRALIFAGLAVAAVAIQLARMWRSKPLNSIFGEDGYIWLSDAAKRSFLHDLTTPYNGYLQTVSRLVAEPVALLPIDWFAAAMAISGAVIVTACAYVVWRASAGHIGDPYLRIGLAAIVVLLPIVGAESLDNVTNSIWFLVFASFWVLLWRPATFGAALAAAAFLFLATLSDAGVLVFVPLWALRLVAVRDRRDKVMVAGFAIGLAIQLALSWKDLNLLGEAGSPQINFSAQWHWSLLLAYLQRVVGGVVTGQRITGYLWVHLGTSFEVVLGIALVALIVIALGSGNRRTHALVPLMVATSIAAYLVAGYKRWTSAGYSFLWPHGTAWTDASHYMIVPTLLLLSALFVQLDAHPRFVSATTWNRAGRVGMVLVVVAALFSFNVSDSSRGQLPWQQAVDTARTQCLRKHLDANGVAQVPGYFGAVFVQVPCSKLTGSGSASFPSRSATVTLPASGASLSATSFLKVIVTDGHDVTSVKFLLLTGGNLIHRIIATATLTSTGWTAHWKTTSVANGIYLLEAVAYYQGGDTAYSTPVPVTVNN